MTDGRHPAWTEESRFRGALDDVIIIPLVVVALVTNKKQHDKRATKKEADDKREMDRSIKRAR